MTRISLKEAYDNKDVVTQIARLTDEVNEHTEILDNLPNPDLTNCVLKTGDQTIAGEKTFTDMIKAEGGIEVNTSGGFEVDGALIVNGDIIQTGQAYETHAEQVFSENDLIVTRDGAVSSLPSGGVSGIQVKKYNGVNDGRLVMDNTGTARVGDVGDEQPLMTRDEVGDMIGGGLLKWDAVHSKAVSSPMDSAPTAGSINAVTSGGIKTAIDSAKTTLETAIAGKVGGTGNIGSDTKPIKIVNGVAVAVDGTIPTKASADTVQHTTYWRMDVASNWTTIFTNNTDNIMVGWLRYSASGSTGVLNYIVGQGDYIESLNISDYETHIMPLVIPPHTSINYTSTFFINAWATLYEVKLA